MKGSFETVVGVRAKNGTSLIALALAGLVWPALAAAQEAESPAPTAAEQTAQTDADMEIVVTGSRIARSGFSAPTPVSVVGTERLEQRAVTNIGDALNEMPSFRATNGPAAQGLVQNGYIGGRILDLRGLGAVRTLTLVDGKRFVPSTTQSTVDTNMIPSILLERAEVVTGGASAAYGSDAVAGVVNLILNKKLEGIKGSAQMGISKYGDDRDTLFSLAGGTALNDRLHLVVGGEYQKNNGVGNCQERDWCREEWLNFGRPPGVTGIPANNILPNIHPSTISRTGVINSARDASGAVISTAGLKGITFNADGTPRLFQYGSMVNNFFMIGGEGKGQDGYFDAIPLKSPTERYSAYGRLTWDATDNITAGLDFSYGRLKAKHHSVEYKNIETPILRDNPFIPTSTNPALDVRGILDANPNIASFRLGRTYNDIGYGNIEADNQTYRVVASLEGKLSDRWSWDAYYQYGHNDFRSETGNNPVSANFVRAVNAVRDGSGNIVCRDLLSSNPATVAAAAGCVPINPFGNQVSAAAMDYVTATAFQTNVTKEHVLAANLSGEVIDLWAGPLSVALGGEFRSDKVNGDADAISKALGFFAGNGSQIAGKIDVTEGYIEAELPLAKDMTLLQELSLNGAVRRTHYKREGAGTESSVNATTWKLGAVWQPVDWLRFRGTKSRDIRAPNVSELFGPTTTAFGILTDRANGGAQTQAVILSGANPLLVPEKADSFTVGVVFQPQGDFLSRIRASVDYYDIKIDDAIGTLGQQTIADRCFAGATEFCSLITRDASNTITQIRDVQQNVNQLITRGWDVEFTYRQPLGGMGDLDVRVLATIVNDLITKDAAGSTDRAGMTGMRGGTVPGIPDYTLDGLVTWTNDPITLSLHARYIPKGIYNTAFVGPDQPGYSITATNSSNTNSVPDATYVDILAQFDFLKEEARKATFYVGVDNLFDKDPPRVPGANGTGNNVLFNPVGQTYKAGIRFTY